MIKFGERLRELREEKGLSQEALGRELGFTQTGIAKWELGLRTPNIEAMILVAKYFKCSLDYLVGLEDY